MFSAGTSVNFKSNIDLYPFFAHGKCNRFIPDFSVAKEMQAIPFEIEYYDEEQCHLNFGVETAKISYPWSEMRNGETLIYLAYPFMEVQHQTALRLTAHAACVSLSENRGVLLLGKQGSGKTSLAIDLCRHFGASLIANDLCILGWKTGIVYGCGGSKFFFIRYEVAKRNIPDLLKYFKEPQTKDTWLTKTIISPEALEVKVESKPTQITKAYLVHVDETKSELFAENADGLVTRLFLNENFSRYIRTTCVPMLGGANYDFLGYVPSFDKKEFFENRVRLINALLYEVGILYVSGPLRKVTEFIVANKSSLD